MSTADCHRRATCRLCDGRRLMLVLSLEPTPPANAFVPPEAAGTPQACFPLDVHICEDCGHVQLLDVVDPRVLFEDYVYVSGTSPVFVRHFEDYAGHLLERYTPPAGGRVLDIGSNDGTLLNVFREKGFSVLGVDPARAIAAEATARGIETLPEFFTSGLATALKRERGAFDIVTANNVFAHADDLADIADGVRELLAPGGVFAFEVSYLVDVVEKTLFDTIYHEHLAYHAVKPLVRFFAAHGLEMIEARRVPSHGGSLRGVVQAAGGPRSVDPSVAALIGVEERMGIDRAPALKRFAAGIETLKGQVSDLLNGYKRDGRTLAGFGAPAKATTLMYHFGFGPELIDFIVDDSPLKQGLLSPGMHIPVLASDALYERRPDYAVVLAWNFADPIIANHQRFLDGGGHFVVPLPELRVI